jgi:hypothetical protein
MLKLLTSCLPKAGTVPNGRISKRSVDLLHCPSDKDRIFLWDDSLAGFGVAAFATGRKTYCVQYRQLGRTRRASIGEHGRLTPDEARSEAKKLLGDAARGLDPTATRKAARAVSLFREIAGEFMRAHIAAKRKPLTFESYKTLLRLHILPAIGALRMTEIRRAHISKMHSGAAHPGAANRALTVVSSIWNWAAREHEELVFPQNPVKGLKRNPEKGRERFLDHAELGRLGEALMRAENEGLPYSVDETKPSAKHAPKPENRLRLIDPFAVAAIRLLHFTGARLREILHAKWEYVDFERGFLNLPDSKVGKRQLSFRRRRSEFWSHCHGWNGTPLFSPAQKMGCRGPISNVHGMQSYKPRACRAYGSTICAIASPASAPAAAWGSRSLASCSAMRRQV